MRKVALVLGLCSLFGLASMPAASAGGGGGCHDRALSVAATNRVALIQNCFGPTVAHVAVGTSITFVNNDQWPHTVTGANFGWGSADQLDATREMTVAFDEAGVYPFVCLLHPGMVGAVVVGDEVADPVDSTLIAAADVVLLGAGADSARDATNLALWMWMLAGSAVAAVAIWASRSAKSPRSEEVAG